MISEYICIYPLQVYSYGLEWSGNGLTNFDDSLTKQPIIPY